MNLRLDGKIAAAAIKEELKEKIASLPSKICLGIIRFDDPASESYLKGRLKIANELGVDVKVFVVEDNKTNEDLLTLVNTLNNDPSIHGIMIDRPLPRKYNEFEILSSINPIVCSILGGLLMGVGCGIIYRIGGSTGGFDVPGLIINKYTRIKLSIVFLCTDGLLVVLALVAKFSLYEIVIGLLSVIAYSIAVAFTQRMGNEAYFCDIISDKWEEINREILALDRGTTIVDVTGGFTGRNRKMIKTMVGKNQYLTIIDIVKKIDPSAFMSITLTHSVFGEGYNDIKTYSNK